MIYRTNFTLLACVQNFKAAHKYLTEDDMTKYLLNDDRGCDKVVYVRWELVDECSGYIEVVTTEPLTEEESANISSWISGQCSDGLGEGFEQQDWACYIDEDNEDEYWDDEDYCDNYVMASFDWQTNDYKLQEV